ncbi:hypothetical protein UFOVP273_5 [uncultured Caudovirales phage]|uniref:Uncharacterized protein n=1 Tax=uncultured Caudovirales phage TaxID=2100421 RepID=A0A6J5LQU1_9CAUD|nr:hypothetical protein UFOVP273_5 [uncultured Caudovirales phage]
MTANAVQLNPGSGGNKILTDTVSTIDGSTSVPAGAEAQVTKVAFGGAGAVSNVTTATPLPTQVASLYYPTSTANSTSAQLAAGASFVGNIENIQSLQAAQVEVICDQPYQLTIFQYADSGGTKLTSQDTITRPGGVPFNQNISLPGNYFKLSVKNLGTATTTTLLVDTTFGIMDTVPRKLGIATRAESLPVTTADGIVHTLPNAFTLQAFSNAWNVSVASGDLVTIEKQSNGQNVLVIAPDPTKEDQTTTLTSTNTFNIPTRLETEISASQRIKGSYLVLEAVDNTLLATPTAFSIASIQQATTTLTIILNSAYDGDLGDWVCTYGISDSRMNYFNLCIASISLDGKTLTATVADENTITSLSVGPFTSQGFLIRTDKLGNAGNGTGLRFSGVSASAVALIFRSNYGTGGSTGTFTGSQTSGSGVSTPVYTGNNGYVEVKPSVRTQLSIEPEQVVMSDRTSDANSLWNFRTIKTSERPSITSQYSTRLRTYSPKSQVRPQLKIKSAAKSGTTVATIVTTAAHNLTTTSYVSVVGVRDQTNFANMSVPAVVASVVDTTTFTIALGAAVTASSYGGGVVPSACAGLALQGSLVGAATTAARDSAGVLTLVGTGTWGGNVGDYVQLYGCIDSTGTDTGLDGVYRIKATSTTTLTLSPAYDYLGNLQSPGTSTVTLTNVGGLVVNRTTYRIHDLLAFSYGQQEVRIYGQGTGRTDVQMPVLQSSRGGLGSGWNVLPDNSFVNDLVSTVVTTSGTFGPYATNNSAGGGVMQASIIVTAASGTTPTLDFVMQESDDGGTNWYDIYHFERITSTGQFRSPPLPTVGRNFRFVRTIGGTTPSFTLTINRQQVYNQAYMPFKQIFARGATFDINTLSAVSPTLKHVGGSKVQLVFYLSAIGSGAAPVIQLQGCDDLATVSWYNIGTPLTGAASAGVYQVTVPDVHAQHLRAIVTTAATGATNGYILLKSFGG